MVELKVWQQHGLAGEGMEGEGINALGMDDAPAGLADEATVMKTAQDNGGNAGGGIFPRLLLVMYQIP